MKKKTISAILWVVIAALSVAIIVLCIKISQRGPKPEEDMASLSEDEISDGLDLSTSTNTSTENKYEARYDLVASPNTTSSVNVRSGAGTDYERIGSAYSNNEYVVLEILSNGWTKLDYEGQDGYISTELLNFKSRQDLGDGTYSYDAVDFDLTDYKAE